MSGLGQAAGLAVVAAANITIAEMQRRTEKEKLEFQKEIWETQKKWAEMYHNLWNEKYKPVEIAFLDHVARREPYVPQYDAAESRAVVAVRKEFAAARERVRKCIDPRCFGESCHTNKVLAIEEAKAAVSAANRGFRAEEARKDAKDAQWEDLMIAVLQLGRGLATGANQALSSAAQTASAASNINPLGGYAAAIGNITGMVSEMLTNRPINKNAYGNPYARQTGGRGVG